MKISSGVNLSGPGVSSTLVVDSGDSPGLTPSNAKILEGGQAGFNKV